MHSVALIKIGTIPWTQGGRRLHLPWVHHQRNLSIDIELRKLICNASATMAKLAKRVWKNKVLSQKTNFRVCQAFIFSTALIGRKPERTLTESR
ncbi:hypothetical protein DPMN_031122 [Dreissena polymorpha]|uniref:Uncharacterized protein n=1 Tax=Dreissena polymorpha TaxID=45954 RepID=A0A9D4M3Z4_DREPO|nr:hypothetical protein DPMN_031122 [Dreissena polymorpha]